MPTDTFSVHKCIRCYQDRHFQGSLLSNFSGQILRGDHKRYVLEKPTHACLLLPSTLLSFQQKNCIIQFMYNDTQIRLVKVVAHPGSTLNIDLILWHTQLILCAENVKSWFKSRFIYFPFQAYKLPHALNCICVSLFKFHICIF